jgi:dihydropteroate synthase
VTSLDPIIDLVSVEIIDLVERPEPTLVEVMRTPAVRHAATRALRDLDEHHDVGPWVAVCTETEEVVATSPSLDPDEIDALHARFDVPLSADTWRAAVLDAACTAGAVVGNDISGFGDPDYLRVAAKHAASVVATHIRLKPRVADPDPHYGDVLADVTAFLLERAAQAEGAGLAPEQISLDAGLDLGKTPAQSALLLRESAALAGHGYALLLSASNKRFLGDLLGLDLGDRRAASLAAVAYGVAHGCRIVRVHDVAGSAQVCRMVGAILEAHADEESGARG